MKPMLTFAVIASVFVTQSAFATVTFSPTNKSNSTAAVLTRAMKDVAEIEPNNVKKRFTVNGDVFTISDGDSSAACMYDHKAETYTCEFEGEEYLTKLKSKGSQSVLFFVLQVAFGNLDPVAATFEGSVPVAFAMDDGNSKISCKETKLTAPGRPGRPVTVVSQYSCDVKSL